MEIFLLFVVGYIFAGIINVIVNNWVLNYGELTAANYTILAAVWPIFFLSWLAHRLGFR